MKLLFVITSLANDGPTHYLYYLISNLPRDQFEVEVCCLHNPELQRLFAEINVRVTCVGSKHFADFTVLGRIRRTIRDFRPDVITTTLLRADLWGRLASIGYTPHVFSIILNQDDYRKGRSLTEKVLVMLDTWLANRYTETLFVEAEAVRDYCLLHQKIRPEMFRLLPSMIAVPDWVVTAPARGNIDSQAPKIVTAGRLHPQKSQDILIRAAGILKERWPQLRLEIIGEGELRSELEVLAESLGLAENTSFVGYSRDLFTSLNQDCIYVMTSGWEGGAPITVLHAMAIGLPIVTTNVGGIDSFIAHGHQGLLVPFSVSREEIVDRVAEAIQQFLENSQLRARFSVAVKERLLRDFTASSVASRFSEHCTKILRRSVATKYQI